MIKLYKYELDFDRTIEFVKDSLDKASTLSSELANLVNFKSGFFSTVLTFETNISNLYEFNHSAISQFSLPTNEVKSNFQQIREELGDLILFKLNSNERLTCIFDEATRNPNEPNLEIFYNKKAIYLYKNEIVYVINKQNQNRELISDCIWKSFSFWHSVGVLTEADCFKNDNALTLEDIQTICRKTKIILISAYDGEGYILWEKKE